MNDTVALRFVAVVAAESFVKDSQVLCIRINRLPVVHNELPSGIRLICSNAIIPQKERFVTAQIKILQYIFIYTAAFPLSASFFINLDILSLMVSVLVLLK